MNFEPLGLDHVVLRVRDQEASQRFYTDVLGCKVDHFNERISLLQLRFGEQLIDLLPGERGQGESTGGQGGGMDHFCLSVRCDDLAAVAEDFTRRGVALEGGVVQRRGAYGIGPSLYLRDPDGYLIELKPR
jgi:glyoxylase I family protein